MVIRTVLQGDMVKICMSFKGTLFCNNNLDQNFVSFMHNTCMHKSNACLNWIASFKSLHPVL